MLASYEAAEGGKSKKPALKKKKMVSTSLPG
jgi:hypothetical protein